MTSLKTKIIGIIILVLLIGFAILVSTTLKGERENLTLQGINKSRMLAESVLWNIRSNMEEGRPDIARMGIEYVKKTFGIEVLQVVRADGTEAFIDSKTIVNVINRLDPKYSEERRIIKELQRKRGGEPRQIDDPRIREVFKTSEQADFLEEIEGKRVITHLLPIPNDKVCHRCHGSDHSIRGVLRVSISADELYKEIKRNSIYLILKSLFIISTAVLSLYLLLHIVVIKPLLKFADTVKMIEMEGEIRKVNITSRDEIGMLAGFFNSMIEKLIHADRLVSMGKMVAGIAHEIKNPLSGISGAVEIIAEDDTSTEVRKDLLNAINEQINRLNRLVKDLLRFAKPGELELLTVNIKDIILSTINLLAKQLAGRIEKRIEIIRDFDDTPIMCKIDCEKIQQVFFNIGINAIESIENGGSLKVTVTEIPNPNFPKQKNIIRILFKDTGKGIPQEDINKIFNMFYSTKSEGTGLGLSISRRIIEQHGGNIMVNSKVGEGSEFILDLPCI